MDDKRPSISARSSSSNQVNFAFLERMLSIRKRSSETPIDGKGALGLVTSYSSSEPLIEYIFVHGLGGGSRKTWSESEDPGSYWPKEWLSKDPAFKKARVHSFGYNANWAERKESSLNIHDFGQSLLDSLRNNPQLLHDEENPFVFVGHSMGGLVIKQAYLLARRDPACATLAKRFHAMVFLATPHRGSDFAQILNNVLRMSIGHSAKPYVANLEKNSEILAMINDEFRHYAQDVALYSYYETQPTDLGVHSGFVVKKDSATLGYPGERVAPLNADHRGICKFDRPSNPNYIIIRNCFQAINGDIMKKLSEMKVKDFWSQLFRIGNYLGVSERPEDDLSDLQEAHMEGSCEWFPEKIDFQAWMDPFSITCPRIFWVSANPATGKSVLAGYIIGYLEGLNFDCSYYFFHYGDKMKSSLSGCLRSIAYQMAMSSVITRKKLLSMIEHNVCFDKEDERAVWRRIFTTTILRDDPQQAQYWVIDALDECSNMGAFFQMISRFESTVPVRIFVTSRKSPEITDQFCELQRKQDGQGVICEEMSTSDTQNDIRLYLNANMKKLRVGNDKSLQDLSRKILTKSRGCFLWVKLVLEEMAGAWSQHQIEQVLEEVPQDMDLFYARALDTMSLKPTRTKQLTKFLLIWTMCAARPLTINELQTALKLDLGDDVEDLESAIISLCGQLVYVDKSKRIQMIHLTARTFLLAEGLQSEFAIDKRLSHLRLAEICLQYLNGDEMKSPRARRASRGLHPPKRSPFLIYAGASFSEHIRQTSSDNKTLTGALDTFLKTNVLSWIEHIAQSGNLDCLTWTAKVLKNYLQRQAQHQSPISKEVQRIEAWATDFNRLTAKFGRNLIESPSSIYWLVPPFCPSSSAIASQFALSPRGLTVYGLSDTDWDDRLACIIFENKQATALCCGDNYFAVGLSIGEIALFHNATCQEWKVLSHGEPLKHLKLDGSRTMLASGSRKILKVWDVENEKVLWKFSTSFDILTFAFRDDGKSLTAVTKGNTLQSWSLETGSVTDDCLWEESFKEQQFRRPPLTATLNSELNMLAIVYRGRPISLWDMDDQAIYGFLGRESDPSNLALGTNTSVSSLVFSCNESISLLAAAYEDGDLALFKYWDLKLVKSIEANAQIVASSPDGCTLITGNSVGMMQLFEFETLQLLYRVNAFDYGIRSLAFSSDSLRFLDIRGRQCNIWEPSILIGLNQHEEDSLTKANLSEPRIIGVPEDGKSADITTMVIHESGKYLFCGKSDGSIWSYEMRTAKQRLLYNHTEDIPILFSLWGVEAGVLVTADAAARFMARKIVQNPSNGDWIITDALLDAYADFAIRQLLLDPSGNLLLVSTSKSDTIWDILGSAQLSTKTYDSRASFFWINHPLDRKECILISTRNVSLWEWNTSWPFNPRSKMEFGGSLKVSSNEVIKNVIQIANGNHIAVEFSKPHGDRSTTQLYVLESENLHTITEEISPALVLKFSAKSILHMIGAYGKRIVFLDRDFWVCTVDTEYARAGSYIRHFFIPSDWYSQQKQLIFEVSNAGEVLFVKANKIAIIKNGFQHEEVISIPSSM